MRKTPMGTCQQPCSVVRDPSGTPFVVSKNNTCKRSFGGITIKIHYKIKYLKVPTYDGTLHRVTPRQSLCYDRREYQYGYGTSHARTDQEWLTARLTPGWR